jgi:hypothetical protein
MASTNPRTPVFQWSARPVRNRPIMIGGAISHSNRQRYLPLSEGRMGHIEGSIHTARDNLFSWLDKMSVTPEIRVGRPSRDRTVM